MSLSLAGSLVSSKLLAIHLDHADLVVLDGSFNLPGVAPIADRDTTPPRMRGDTPVETGYGR